MMTDQITIRRNAARDDVQITVDNRVTLVDTSNMTQAECATLVTELFHWKRKGFVGYPEILRG